MRDEGMKAVLLGCLTALCALITLFLGVGLEDTLVFVCTELMYARGWLCFVLWTATVTLARPMHVSHEAPPFPQLHGAAWTLGWLWWAVAVLLADLHSRADLLFFAYLATGILIAGWRLLLHRHTLQLVVRDALRNASYAPGVIEFAGANAGDPIAAPQSGSDRCLHAIARFRRLPSVAAFDRAVFGIGRPSALLLVEAMENTDARCLRLREAIRACGDTPITSPEHNYLRDTERKAASDAARAFRCEAEIWLSARSACAEQTTGGSIQRRALAVFSLLALCLTRGSICDEDDFNAAASALAENESFPSLVVDILRDARTREVDHFERLMDANDSLSAVAIYPRILGQLSIASTLARLFLVRQALSLLENGRRDWRLAADHDGTDDGARQLEETVDSLVGEIERSSIQRAGPPAAERPRSPQDERVIGVREARQRSAMMAGRHPSSGARVVPSDFARLPRPLNPREVGAGIGAAGAAVSFTAIVVALIWWYPLTARTQTVFEVPLGGKITSTGVHAATVVQIDGTETVLLADPKSGVRTLRLDSLRTGAEGGKGTALDGTVRKLATNADGTALAIFDSAGNGSPCLSVRDRSGNWNALIAPSLLAVNGDEIEAALLGFDEPLFLRKSGAKRLMQYSEKDRTLFEAQADRPYAIDGGFIDFAEGRSEKGERRIVLLTKLGESSAFKLYDISQSSGVAPIRVIPLETPSLKSRTAVAVCLDSEARLVLLDSGGGAWRSMGSYPARAQDWTRIRAGDQGLELDRIDLAVVADDGRRLWFIRDGEVWTRPLVETTPAEEGSAGWSKSALPAPALSAPKDRWQVVESSGIIKGIFLIAPGDPLKQSSGSLLQFEPNQRDRISDGESRETFRITERLQAGETLLDGDALASRGIVAILEAGAGNSPERSVRLDVVGNGLRTIYRTPVLESGFGLEGLAAVGSVNGDAYALATSGAFIRFDPTRDILKPVDAPGKDYIGKLSLPVPPVDASIAASADAAFVDVLAQSGSVYRSVLRTGEPAVRIVDTASGPPTAMLSPRFVVTDSDGATLFSESDVWRYSLKDAGNPFSRQQSELGLRPASMLLTKSPTSGTAVAWLASDGQELRSFTGGAFAKTRMPLPLTAIRAGFPDSLFALDTAGALRSASLDGESRVLLPPQRNGPDAVLASALRGGFVDYLDHDSFHSIRRSDGAWSSAKLDGDYELHSLDGATQGTMLLPRGAGIPKLFLDHRDAGNGIPLDKFGPMKSQRILGEGVIGLAQRDGLLGWVPLDNSAPLILPDRRQSGLTVKSTVDAIPSGDRLFLLGSSDGVSKPDRVARYTLSGQTAVARELPTELLSMELGPQALYVLSPSKVHQLDPETLQRRAEHPTPSAGQVMLGEMDPGARNMAVASSAGVHRVDATGLSCLLVPPPAGTTAVPTFSSVAVSGDRVVIFTPDGAWQRTAGPDSPFTRVPHLAQSARLVTLAPDGRAWGLVGDDWVCTATGTTASRGIGWTSRGERIQVLDGIPTVGGAKLGGFEPSPVAIGTPIGVEPLNTRLALLIGTSGSVLFDTWSRAFEAPVGQLRGLKQGVTIFDREGLSPLALGADGLVTSIAQTPDRMFGGLKVDQLLVEPALLARTAGGAIVDDRGIEVKNLPPKDQGKAVKVRSTALVATELYRVLDDRSVDVVDVSNFTQRQLPWTADSVATAGGRIVALSDQPKRVELPSRRAGWDAEGWFVGPDTVAFWRDDAITILSESPRPMQRPAAEPLPGQIVGNLPNSTAALVRRSGGAYSLFDLLTGTTLVRTVPGRDPFIGEDAIWSLSDDGDQVMAVRADGRIVRSPNFESVYFVSTDGGVDSYALRIVGREASLIRLDRTTLAPGELAERWTSRYPELVSTRNSPLTVVQLTQDARLIIGSESIALDDGKSVQTSANPLGVSQPSLEFESGRIVAEGAEGRRAVLLEVSGDGFRLDVRIEPQRSPLADERFKPFRIPRWPIYGQPAPSLLKLSVGTLDTKTGWLIEEQPTRLVNTPEGLSVEFRGGVSKTVVPRAATKPRPEFALRSPLRLERESLVIDRAEGKIELGAPIVGIRLAAHQVKAAAPISAADRSATGMAWIDRLGQLWTSDGNTTICASTGRALTAFKADREATIYAAGNETLLPVPWHGERPKDLPRKAAQLFDDCSSTEGQASWIAWESPKRGETFQWSIVLADGSRAPITATSSGFNLLSGRALGVAAGTPALVLPSEAPPLSVPIVRLADGSSSVDWTSPPSTVASRPAPTGRAPRARVSSSGIDQLAIEGGSAWVELNGARFAYEQDKNRFEFNQCRAASSSDGRLTTLLEGDDLLAWQRRGDGSWGNPQRISPPATPTGAIWSSDGALMIEVKAGPGEYWRLNGGSWQKVVPTSVMRSADARWDWDGSALKLLPEGETYRFVENRWPRLDFEEVDATARPRIDATNRVAYRTQSGAWFQIDGGMPKRLASPPEPLARAMPFDELIIERPTAVDPAVRAKLGDVAISLRIEDGLIPDIDDWRASETIVPVGSDRALIKVGSRIGSQSVYRPIELRAQSLWLLPPLDEPKIRSELARALPRFVRTKQETLSLDAGHALRVGSTSLGVPGPSGFPQFDPLRVIPILTDPSGELRLVFDGEMFSASVGNLIDSFKAVGNAKGIAGTAWIQAPEGLQFIATAADGRSFALDAAGLLQPLNRTLKPSESVDVRGSDLPGCFESTSVGQRISLRRRAPEPFEVHLVGGSTGQVVAEHTQASRIVSSDDGFTTYSDKWSARYRVANGGATLASTQTVDRAAWAPSSVPLGDTLVARQRGGSSRWNIGPASEEVDAIWPFSALSQPPSRVYAAAGNTALEAGTTWMRRRADDGAIIARKLHSVPPAVASSEARRRGNRVLALNRLYSVTDGEPVQGGEVEQAAGSIDWRSAGPWEVRLERSGAALQMIYGGVPIEPQAGALPLDFAVAVGSHGDDPWLVDRLAVARLGSNALDRSVHEESIRSALATTMPRRMLGRDIAGKTVRALRCADGTSSFDLVLPQPSATSVQRAEAETPFESWTAGSRLAVRLRTDGLTEFLRADARGGWTRYPMVAHADSCRVGRFPFDNPVDLFLASRPNAEGPQGCVALQLGWEWPVADGESAPTLMLNAPARIAPEFGSKLDPTWLVGSDLDASDASAVTQRAGLPFIWYPSGGRLFVVGERSAMWIELDGRWRGRPVMDD
jgi:hypothetical protein